MLKKVRILIGFSFLMGSVLMLVLYFYSQSTKTFMAGSCGTIYEGVGYHGTKASSEKDKEQAVQCLTQRFESCESAALSVRALGFEGEAYEFDFQIKPTAQGCSVERYNWGERVNTCHGIESVDYIGEGSRSYHFVMTSCDNPDGFTNILQSYKIESL